MNLHIIKMEKENKEMKERIYNIENQLSIMNLNFGIFKDNYIIKLT